MKSIYHALRWLVYYAVWHDWMDDGPWSCARHVLAWAGLLAILLSVVVVAAGISLLVEGGRP